jgi:1-aminocyclopropane-1-carboxylate deaminase
MLVDLNIKTEHISWKTETGNTAQCTVARLDLLHPFISGNKYFKLKYHLNEALSQGKGIITMGGAYSNHLAATAFACYEAGVPSVGIIRGERIESLNPTLLFCTQHQMQFIFVKRNEFTRSSNAVTEILNNHPNYFFVPEGGDSNLGEKGATEIASHIHNFYSYTHIFCTVGTGTTYRGLLQSANEEQTCIAVPVLKIKESEQGLFIKNHLQSNSNAIQKCLFGYAGNGYAKKDDTLISFMNRFYKETNVPLDFVYTGKLMMAISTMIDKKMIAPSAKLLVLHTGGLQGNQSLPVGTLHY